MSDRMDKFTEHARRVLELAREEAQRFNHDSIGTEHLLLALVREAGGVGAKVLANLRVDSSRVRSAVDFAIRPGEGEVADEIGLSPRAQRVIELSVDEARRLGHRYIGTEHLLLGLVRDGEGIAARVLESLGVSLERARTQVVLVLEQSAREGKPLSGRIRPVEPRSLFGRLAERLGLGQPQPARFGKFTEDARRVLQTANEQAGRYGHSHIAPEHLLLALAGENKGPAAQALREVGLDLDRTRAAFERAIAVGDQPAAMAGLTEPAKRTIEATVGEARRLGHLDIGPEHLLLGLLAQPETQATRMLEGLGTSPEQVRAALERRMGIQAGGEQE